MNEERISHGHGQMRAQSFSIMVSSRTKCNAGCEFCISRTTPGDDLITKAPHCHGQAYTLCDPKRLITGLNYAKYLGATHAILTGKADPLQEDPEYLIELIKFSRDYLPLVDMHTNGLVFHTGMHKEKLLDKLFAAGLTMITFSIASFNPAQNCDLMHIKKSAAELIQYAASLGLLVRCSLVVNKQGVDDAAGVIDYIKQAGELGAHMVVVREVWVPEIYGQRNHKVFEWNKANKVGIKPIQDKFIEYARYAQYKEFGITQRDPLPWGTPVFAMGGVFTDQDHGVNITFACCDEGTTGEVIKSIVHKPNGHGFRNWDHDGDILY
jgi:MoaA/NifB/PqqE/SkfB family radical SAM enzyme